MKLGSPQRLQLSVSYMKLVHAVLTPNTSSRNLLEGKRSRGWFIDKPYICSWQSMTQIRSWS